MNSISDHHKKQVESGQYVPPAKLDVSQDMDKNGKKGCGC